MKTILFTSTLFLLIISHCEAQTRPSLIDKIHTARQIEKLLRKNDKRLSDFHVNPIPNFYDTACQLISDSLHFQSWQKADFDNNGLTDLLVVGYWSSSYSIFCLLDKGKDVYEMQQIQRRFSEDCLIPMVHKDSITSIEYYSGTIGYRATRNSQKKINKKTLVYKYGGFVEMNPGPAAHIIEKVEFETSRCFGECPVFTMALQADRTATWEAILFNKISKTTLSGVFNGTIDEEKYRQLVSLLNYIDFASLLNDYTVPVSDQPSSKLKITYDGGKIKLIDDYSLTGTFGLQQVYKILFDLRSDQQWHKQK